MRNAIALTLLAVATAGASVAEARDQPGAARPAAKRVVQRPMPGRLELALQLTGNVAYTDTTTADGDDLTLWVPNVDFGAFVGTGVARGWAIGYHGRLTIEPAEIAHRHAASLALVRDDGAVLIDAGFGLFDAGTVKGASVLFGTTVQAKLWGSGFSLVVPLYCDIMVSPAVDAWATFGVGIGYTTL